MNKSKTKNDVLNKRDTADCHKNTDSITKPTLYSSIIQTEAKLKQISLTRLEPKQVTNKAGIKEINFPLKEKVYDYANMVDVGLHSGGAKTVTRSKPKLAHSKKKPEPRLSDYYQPDFNNVQQIQMNSILTAPELTVQYDGLAISRLLDDIDNLVFE